MVLFYKLKNMQSKIEKLKKLMELFEANKKRYKSASYDEANTRVDFIDKFFDLLDWDIRNDQGFSEDYREVVREDKVVIEGKPKAPDYSFRIGGHRKFFVEAKKPAVNIKKEISPAFQVRRYAYTAKLPLSILTDFEEFAIYDTRIKPNETDKASTARIFYCTFDEYEKNFDFIYNTFSKTAILKGSFDKYIDDNKRKKGTSEVDKEFLKLIDGWRNELAKNIALRNSDLTVNELNHAIQKIIDRLIFLRIAEDRKTEPYGTLSAIVKETDIYHKLNLLFLKADKKYNSGLFEKEAWLSNLKIDDRVFASIIKHLYYPDCPYEFSVLPVEILGNIYEQFLGKTIRLTAGHRAIIEEKPEVRKAGGVYYTPQYIVDYIVKNTVGEKIKGKKPEEISKLKILDPACGSGSFLLGAFEHLKHYHIDYYSKPKNLQKAIKQKKIYQVDQNTYKLTIEEKKKILMNNIYGVDIDPQAVEVTKLSLLLKLMEDENLESRGQLFTYSDITLLPNLSENIKCGNSLIGPDIEIDDIEELKRIKPFDWNAEFSGIMKNGGFDVVIGNPPYLSMEDMDKISRNYYYGNGIDGKRRYFTAVHKSNLYSIFLEKNCSLANKRGLIGMITPYSWLSNSSFINLRKLFLFEKTVVKLQLFPLGIFQDAGIKTGIVILKNAPPIDSHEIDVYDFRRSKIQDISQLMYKRDLVRKIPTDTYKLIKDYIFNVEWKEDHKNILEKVEKNKIFLGDITNIDRGCDTANNDKYLNYNYQKSLNSKPLLAGEYFGRYWQNWNGLYIYYQPKQMKKEKNTARPGEAERFEQDEKLIIYRFLDKLGRLISIFDNEKYYCLGSCYVISKKSNCDFDLFYILGILNSKLTAFLNRNLFSGVKVTRTELLRLPIHNIDFSKAKEKNKYNMILKMVKMLLDLYKKLIKTKDLNTKTLLQRQIDATDKQIDELVFELYGLTEKERGIVTGD